MEKEKIKCAALRKDGKIYIGKCHGDIFCQEPIGVLKFAEQGFITFEGKFVDRKEGLKIAEEAGQIVEKHRPWDQLMSEDFETGLE